MTIHFNCVWPSLASQVLSNAISTASCAIKTHQDPLKIKLLKQFHLGPHPFQFQFLSLGHNSLHKTAGFPKAVQNSSYKSASVRRQRHAPWLQVDVRALFTQVFWIKVPHATWTPCYKLYFTFPPFEASYSACQRQVMKTPPCQFHSVSRDSSTECRHQPNPVPRRIWP